MSIIVDGRAPVRFACGKRGHIKKNCEDAKDRIESEAREASEEENGEMEEINEGNNEIRKEEERQQITENRNREAGMSPNQKKKTRENKYKLEENMTDRTETTGYILMYDKGVPAAKEIEGNKDITRILHQNESERTRYGVIKNERIMNFLEKYKVKVYNTGRLAKWNLLGKIITDIEIKDLLV